MVATHAVKGKVRYRYYVSRALHHDQAASGMRIPAREIETLVARRVAALFDDMIQLVATAWLEVPADRYRELEQRCREIAAAQRLRKSDTLTVVEQVRVDDTRITVTCTTEAIATMLGLTRHPDAPATIELTEAARLTRTGRAMRLVQGDGTTAAAEVDQALVRTLATARRWWAELRRGELDITRLAQREGVTPSYMTRVVRLAFLASRVVDSALAGRMRAGVDANALTATGAVSSEWKEQVAALVAG